MQEEFTVSRLSALIKRSLETNFGNIKLTAEVSALKNHSSGHSYFSLKDEDAVIDAICWKTTLQRVGRKLENGQKITCFGRVSSYQMQSKYQFIVENFEQAGVGNLLQLLEERKQKLAKEGLFNPNLKKPVPKFPKIIGVITSPTGAVIRDIIHRVRQRFPTEILLWPVLVQGTEAAAQIEKAIDGMNQLPRENRPDVLIVARGGGSFEDLMPFNEENIVRAVFRSEIPVISAVGHETDTTLIDYVSDLRAPTPTAAAELATPEKIKLRSDLERNFSRLSSAVYGILEKKYLELKAVRTFTPDLILSDGKQRVDMDFERLNGNIRNFFAKNKTRLACVHLTKPIFRNNLNELNEKLRFSFVNLLKNSRHRLDLAASEMEACSYLNILRKGFVRAETEDQKTVNSADEAKKHSRLMLDFFDGSVAVYTKQQISLCDIES